MPSPPLTERARLVAAHLRWPGDPVAIPGLEGPVAAVVDIDENEHEARRGAGLSALLDLRSLAALWELPHRIPIADQVLSSTLTTRLGGVPPWAAVVRDHTIERLVRPPVRISGVVANAATWRRSATALGAFVTVAPRVALVAECDPVTVDVHAEALVWEVGLFREGLGPELLVEPGPPQVEHGPFQWWLAERAYAAWLGTATGQPRPPVAASPGTAASLGPRSSPRS